MKNQVYNLTREDNCIKVWKNAEEIYSISVEGKSINLKELYYKMSVGIEDIYSFKDEVRKIDEPKSDIERIFNNTYDFLSKLLEELNKKTEELRTKENSSSF